MMVIIKDESQVESSDRDVVFWLLDSTPENSDIPWTFTVGKLNFLYINMVPFQVQTDSVYRGVTTIPTINNHQTRKSPNPPRYQGKETFSIIHFGRTDGQTCCLEPRTRCRRNGPVRKHIWKTWKWWNLWAQKIIWNVVADHPTIW